MNTTVKHINYEHPDVLAEYLSESTYDAITRAVSKHIPSGARILDVGCGRGELLKRLSEEGYEPYGCDMDDKCVQMGNLYGEVQKLAVEEISPEKFGDKFDCVVLSHVLEHVENPRDILQRLASVSRGFIVVSIPNPYYLPRVTRAALRMNIGYVNTGHLYSWDWYHFKTFVEMRCGQEVVDWFYDAVTLPAPHPLRMRLKQAGVLELLEKKLLKAALPRFCRSITAVVKVRG